MGFFGGVSSACPYKSQKECTAVSTCLWTKGKRTYCRKSTRKSNGRKSPKKSPAKSPTPWSSVLSSLKRSNRNKKSPAKSPKKSPAKSPKKSPAKSPANDLFRKYINWNEDPRNAPDDIPADLNKFIYSADLTPSQKTEMNQAENAMTTFKLFYKRKMEMIQKGFMSPSFNDSPYDSMVKEYLSKH
jgi:hypothetical protein